ncbi:hypothetical protein ACP70R_021708 [Stipagrostis hirtigluma subsp. patula]
MRFLLYARVRSGCRRHEALSLRLWRRWHGVVASMSWFAWMRRPYRSWSGKVGQLNMLELITRDHEQHDWGWDDEQEEYSHTIVIPPQVKELVLERVREKLVELRERLKQGVNQYPGKSDDLQRIVAQLRTERGEQALHHHSVSLNILNPSLLGVLKDSLGDELQLGILIWHIATDVYLANRAVAMEAAKVSAIRMLSNYMIYLLAVHPEMLPGLVTHKLFQLTCEDVARVWSQPGSPSSSCFSSFCRYCVVVWRKLARMYNNHCRVSPRVKIQTAQERKLATNLYDTWLDSNPATNSFISKGTMVAKELLALQQDVFSVQLIFDVWMEMLFYASYRCSKESHAKQLSYGGELATIVWLMAEHVGLFVIDNTGGRAARHN